jgi:hypothetical protein
MKVPSCVVPPDGETIHSILCRNWERSGIIQTRLVKAFTGLPSFYPLFAALPGYLPTISRSVPSGHPLADVDVAVRCHTLLPYFTYFDPPAERSKAQNMLATQDRVHPVILALGLTRYTSPSCHNPRFCPECIVADEHQLGFTYFHREHQAPGVAVCWLHRCVLARGCASCGPYPLPGRALSMPGRCFCSALNAPLIAYDNLPTNIEVLNWIANESAYMLAAQGTRVSCVRERLRSLAIERGYCVGKHVSHAKLAQALENRFGAEVFDWLGYPAWRNGKPNPWICSLLIVRGLNRRSSTMAFLLFIGLLENSTRSFEDRMQGHLVKNGVSSKKVADQSTGSYCDKGEGGYRFEWTTRLSTVLAANPLSIAAAAAQLRATVVQVLRQAILQEVRIPLTLQSASRLWPPQLLEIHADLIKGMPQAHVARKYKITRAVLIGILADSPGLYQSHRKAESLRIWNKCRKRPGFDWAERDRAIASRLQKAIDQLRMLPKPKRITKAAILVRAGALSKVNPRPEMFPLTQAFLRLNVELRPEFVQRKVKWAINEMSKTGVAASLTNLCKKTNFASWELRVYRQMVLDAALEAGAVIYRL